MGIVRLRPEKNPSYCTVVRGALILTRGSPFYREDGDPGSQSSRGSQKFYGGARAPVPPIITHSTIELCSSLGGRRTPATATRTKGTCRAVQSGVTNVVYAWSAFVLEWAQHGLCSGDNSVISIKLILYCQAFKEDWQHF